MSRNIRRRRVQGGAPTLVGFGAKPHRILPVQFLFDRVCLSLGFSVTAQCALKQGAEHHEHDAAHHVRPQQAQVLFAVVQFLKSDGLGLLVHVIDHITV